VQENILNFKSNNLLLHYMQKLHLLNPSYFYNAISKICNLKNLPMLSKQSQICFI